MSTRTFLGLILLIVALLVASVPELLEPTARGVERAAVTVGVLDKAKPARRADDETSGAAKGEPSERRLALKGYVVEEDGDLRDTVEEADRATFGRTRLERGSSRALLPGQADPTLEAVPPASSEDGVLLDITGCPMFRPDTDVAVLLADPDIVALYEEKIADSDDPEACAPLVAERRAAAIAPATATPLGATTARDRAAIRRGGTTAMIVALSELELLASVLDDAEIQEALEALEAAERPAAGDAAGAAAAPAAP